MIATLFRLPQATRYDLTWDQKALLDVIALLDGKPLHTSELPISARVLRNVIDLNLVEIVAIGPGRYQLTGVGRLVRGKKRGRAEALPAD